jgi:hypothetical protein
MAKKNEDIETESKKNWKEGELVMTFKLTPIREYLTPLMEEWLNAPLPTFTSNEQERFDTSLKRAIININGWNEEELKMKFIAPIIDLGLLIEGNGITTCFDRTISGTVEGIKLTAKSDFMVASGYMNVIKQPYFHFQEYKPVLNPSGEPMAQLLEAFLIAQTKNEIAFPMYGVEVVGEKWKFVIIEGKDYCISPPYIATVKEDLMQIIAILRKFKEILETRLMKM